MCCVLCVLYLVGVRYCALRRRRGRGGEKEDGRVGGRVGEPGGWKDGRKANNRNKNLIAIWEMQKILVYLFISNQ